MEEKPIMLRVISSAVSVASRAGSEVRKVTRTGQLGVVDKGVQDYQTEADRIAQRMIVASLSKKFPKCTIVGEEDLAEDKDADAKLIVDSVDESIMKLNIPDEYKSLKEDDLTIWVDPLDGTTEFVKGLIEHVTVLIGISVKGQSVAGVVHQPFYKLNVDSGPEKSYTGRTIWALVGLGCYGIVSKPLPEDKLVVTTTASHGNKNIEESLEALKPDQILKVGGAGHKVLLVIEGRAHSYVFTSNGCKRWDTSAPEAILKSLGGQVTDSFGNQVEYNYRSDGDYQNYLGIVASINQSIHDKVIAKIPNQVKLRLTDYKSQHLKSKY